VWDEELSPTEVLAAYNLASDATLQYSAEKASRLFGLFEAGSGDVPIGDLTWVNQANVGGSAGDLIALANGRFALNLDGTNGVATAAPEPSTIILLGCGLLVLALHYHRRRRAA
jgi:hypothetical protein